ncbi:MAG: esterase [Bacteroidetes bacterium]|nr:esterase [Bacteroidota bacterium]
MHRIISLFICIFPNCLFCIPASSQIPKVSSGKIIRVENFNSSFVTARNIDIWLPDHYPNHKQPYAVLYMHDGQMLFDSTITWNQQEWKMDETAGNLIRENKTQPFIIVGIWNGGNTRHADYFPQKAFESLSNEQKENIFNAVRTNGETVFKNNTINSDNYLRFIVKELKPFIDSSFTVSTKPQHTFIAGSSMGGLISLYAICEYPDVFGGAACISTHWPGIFQMENNPVPNALFSYLKHHLPNPNNHRLYFDYGTETLDALYPPLQKIADRIILKAGYEKNNWMSVEYKGEDHSEKSWSKRMDVPLLFLMK